MTVDDLNHFSQNGLIHQLGIRFTKFEQKTLYGTIPVDNRTTQPFGYLHGGAMLSLIETLGSAGSIALLNDPSLAVFGISVTAHHLRSVKQGTVQGVAKPVHLGKSTHTWEVKLYDEDGNTVSTGLVMNAIKPIEENPVNLP